MMRSLVMTAVVCLLTTITAIGQTRETARITLPYAILAGGTTLPAGEYTISEQESRSGVEVLVLRSTKGATAAVLGTPVTDPTGDAASATKIVLRHTEGRYELQTIWMQGSSVGYAIQP